MPVILDYGGELHEYAVEDIGDAFLEFKQERGTQSRLRYRKRRGDQASVLQGFSWYYDEFLGEFAKKARKRPKRGTIAYDDWLDTVWMTEPILAGTVYGMVAKAQSKPWRIEGGRSNATRAANMLNDARYSFYKAGWGGFAGSSALDFYTRRIGYVWLTHRRGSKEFGALEGLEHLDARSCALTGNSAKPVWYSSEETGQQIRLRPGEVIQENSLMLTRESALGYGYCAVERAMLAAEVLSKLHEYDTEKLSNLPPEGIASITGLTQDEFLDAIEAWKLGRVADSSAIYPQVLWLMNSMNPSEKISVDLTGFASMPDAFDRQAVVTIYVNILANAFGVSTSDIWFMGGGPFGTGKEVELQHSYARGKGEGEWFSTTQQLLNRELPSNVEFSYDTQNIEEDQIAAATAKGWVDAYMPLIEKSQDLDFTADQWKRLLVEKDVIPEWMITGEAPTERTLIRSDETSRMKETEDVIAFLWEAGKLHERPVITVYRQVDEPKDRPNIRGKPIPDHEVERGARVTRKAVLAEREIWGEIPELADYVEPEGK
jgi:hypothetical protein